MKLESELGKINTVLWWHTGVLSNSRASDNQRNFSCLSGQVYNLELHNKFPKRFLFFFAVSISYHYTRSINYYFLCFCCRKNEIVIQLFVFPQQRIEVVFFFNDFYLRNELFVLVYTSYDISSTTYLPTGSKWLP